MRYGIVPESSTIVVVARSSVGPINWQVPNMTGWVEVTLDAGGAVDLDGPLSAELTVPMDQLVSGNSVYDAEVRRRMNTRAFPTATVALHQARALGSGRAHLKADLTIHGVTRPIGGAVELLAADSERVAVTGEKVVDIRDFDVPAPAMLMLKVQPDVRVHVFAEARRSAESAAQAGPDGTTDSLES